jgi:solute carrier family 25 oxoglutarate transporter 11
MLVPAKAEPPAYRVFLSGGLAAMAGAGVSHPLDVAKVRLQVSAVPLSMVSTLKLVYAEDGVRRGLYRGLSASLTRQALYSSVRFGMYDIIKTKVGTSPQAPLWLKIFAGSLAGGIGAAAASPFDLTLVRMQADARLKPAERRNYRNVFDGVARIVREEGARALWRGVLPTTVRAMVVTASQFAAYDQIKEEVLRRAWMRDGVATHLLCAFTAGFISSVASNPIDVIKTRMMNAPKGEYAGVVDCTVRTVKEGGALALYKGFTPTFVRQAPYVVVMFVVLEQLKKGFAWIDRAEL